MDEENTIRPEKEVREGASRFIRRFKAEQDADCIRADMPPLGTRRDSKEGYTLTGAGMGFTNVMYYFDDCDNMIGVEIHEESDEVKMNWDRKIKVDELPKKVYDQLTRFGGFSQILPFPLLLNILPSGAYVGMMKTSWWEGIRNSVEYKDAVNSVVKLSELIDNHVEKW